MPQNNQEDFNFLTLKLDSFEGPLDLLLHLIKKNEMNIYDIEVSKITEQYLEYLHRIKELRLDIAGEYLVLAAKLLNIKSKMLLPTMNESIEEDMLQDPREELVEQLVEHQQFKEISKKLHKLELDRKLLFDREQEILEEGNIDYSIKEGTTIDLLNKAFLNILKTNKKQKKSKIQRHITTDKYSVTEEISIIYQKIIKNRNPLLFSELFEDSKSIEKLVTSFLAILELVKDGKIYAQQDTTSGPIYMVLKEG